jgi:hypothetical protein
MRKKVTPFQYLLECSHMSLEDFELARLDRAANLRKQLRDIAEEWVEAEVEAQLAHWVRGNRRRSGEPTENIRLRAERLQPFLSASLGSDATSEVAFSTGKSIRSRIAKANRDSTKRELPPPLQILTCRRASDTSASLAIASNSDRQCDLRVERHTTRCEEPETRPDAFAAVRYFRRGSRSR